MKTTEAADLVTRPTFTLADLISLPRQASHARMVILVGAPHPLAMRSALIARETISSLVDFDAVTDAVANGATLMLPNVEQWHIPTAHAALDLLRRTGRNVTSSCFYTSPGRQGLPLHRDAATVVVHQIIGFKTWTVGPPDTSVRESGPTEEPASGLTKVTLRSGDQLRLMPYQAHKAQCEDSPSLHQSWTVGLRPVFEPGSGQPAAPDSEIRAAVASVAAMESLISGTKRFASLISSATETCA